MASSFNNRHWPSMFRSKHGAEPWQAAQPDMSSSPPPSSLVSGGGNNGNTAGSYLKHPSSGYAGGGEERTPDPKPRWNPRPEQIRILEAIFNSGMVNPPRDEIPRIRMRLQEYGQVGDANVFYWFQNRKSRSKNKLRAPATGRPSPSWPARAPPPFRGPNSAAPPPPQPIAAHQQQQQAQLLASPAQAAPTSSSSSSSDRSSGSSRPAAKRAAAQAMSSPTAAAAMDLLGPLAAAFPQMYCQGQPVAPPQKVHDDLVPASDDEPVFQPWPQGYCLSAAEVAAILGGQYMHVPAQQPPPPPASLPAGAFLGLCNEAAAGPAIAGQRTCAAAWGAGVGQYCSATGGGGDHHHQLGLGRNTGAAATNTVGATREVARDDATKLGLLQYCFGDSAAAASPLAATAPADAAVTVASVAAGATTAGLTGLPASSAAPNGVVANYDLLQLQGLAAAGALGVGVTTTTTSTGAPVAVAAAAPAAAQEQEGVAALWITDSVTGRSVAAHSVAAARLDVRAQFGEAALLFRCAGERGLEHVPIDASGCTVQPLQHGAFYYVLV
ncbi:unnamed protein product [Urochloa humidicola]